jgi:hypothetical protein
MHLSLVRRDGQAFTKVMSVHPLFWILTLVSLLALAVIIPNSSPQFSLAVIAGWAVTLCLCVSLARGYFHYFVLGWLAFYPYCYSLLSYPAKRPIFTVDRAFVAALLVDMALRHRKSTRTALPKEIIASACSWALYLLLSLGALAIHSQSDILPPLRLLVDGMGLPAILGLYAIRYFPAAKDLYKLHTCACILGIGLFITGFIELVTGQNLFPVSGASPEFTATDLRRADGPFELHVVLSVVAILTFFFIVYLRHRMAPTIAAGRTLIHMLGAVASLLAALMPLDRGLVLALFPIAILDSFSRNRLISRRVWATILGFILLGGFAARAFDPGLYDDRVASQANFYQRLAQHIETFRVVQDYPVFGVGFGLYYDVASSDARYMATWEGIPSMNVPHNVLMTVLSEGGVVGLLLYVSAQILFIRAMWKIRKWDPGGWLAFLYCLLAYFIIGLDFATVYFADINMLYIFTLGVIFQLQTGLVGVGGKMKESLPLEAYEPAQ